MSTNDEPITFAYWVPNVSGGLVTSDVEQRTDSNYEYNPELAVLAENNGFEYALSQVRYIASYGAAYRHESTSFSLALLLATERLKVIAAVHPGLWQPGCWPNSSPPPITCPVSPSRSTMSGLPRAAAGSGSGSTGS
jgi:FMNH2-dependent dimethyl sulfone monooxygenase